MSGSQINVAEKMNPSFPPAWQSSWTLLIYRRNSQVAAATSLPYPAMPYMDNASFHKRQDTLDALQTEGNTVLWFPPPGFQPDREDMGMDQAVEETMAVG